MHKMRRILMRVFAAGWHRAPSSYGRLKRRYGWIVAGCDVVDIEPTPQTIKHIKLKVNKHETYTRIIAVPDQARHF